MELKIRYENEMQTIELDSAATDQLWVSLSLEGEGLSQEEREKREGLRPKEMLYEEPTRFIRIRDGMYLMSFVEDNMNRVDPTRGGNNLMVLTNMLHGFDCGRTFCLNGQMKLEHGLFKAYGEFIEEDIPVEHEPTPYRV